MKRIFQIILGLIAIAAGLAGAWYGRSTYLESVVTVQLPVPAQDLEPYTLITPDLLTWRDFPRALVAEQGEYATQPEELTGKITTSMLVASLPVPHRRVASPNEFRLADPTLEVLSLPVAPEMAVGGQVQIGDQVNIYRLTAWEEQTDSLIALPENALSIDANNIIQVGETLTETIPTAQPKTFTEIELIATVPVVQVLSGDGTAEADNEEEMIPLQILVLAAPPEVAQDILDAQAATTVGNNQLWITLATPESQ